MITIVHRGTSQTLAEVDCFADLPQICDRFEQQLNDGFAVVAMEEGIIIADSYGYRDLNSEDNSSYDAATATGMYDAW